MIGERTVSAAELERTFTASMEGPSLSGRSSTTTTSDARSL